MSNQISGAKCPHCGAENTFVIKEEFLETSDHISIYSYKGFTVICDEEANGCGKFISFLPITSNSINPKNMADGVETEYSENYLEIHKSIHK